MFESILYNFGYFGIFIIGLISSSLFPLGSEGFVVLMIHQDYNPWIVLLFATAGNYLGSLTNYYIGKYGDKLILSRWIRFDSKKREKAEKIYRRWGSPSLFFSWVPIIGDPLCIIPGILHLDLRRFSFWVLLGKIFRYVVVIAVTLFIV